MSDTENDTLDDILAGDTPAAPETAATPEAVAAEPAVAATQEAVAEAHDDDDDPLPTEDGTEEGKLRVGGIVRLRNSRNDWKEKAIRSEEQAKSLAAQFEEWKKTHPPAPVAAPAPSQQDTRNTLPNRAAAINPATHPAEYAEALRADIRDEYINRKLDESEADIREEFPDAEEKIAAFKEKLRKEPGLYDDAVKKRDPYRWVYQQGKKFLAQREIGDDPDAFRTRLEADIRAKIASEQTATAAPAAPSQPAAAALNLPKSLAGQRSAAPRMAMPITGDFSLEDILKEGPMHS